MKKILFYILSTILFIFNAYSQENNKDNFYKRFEGQFIRGSEKIDFCLNLIKINSKIEANYYYKKNSQNIYLLSEINKDGTFSLKEENGKFKLKLSGNSLTGTWTSNEQKKTYKIKASESYKNSVQFNAFQKEKTYHLYNKKENPSANINVFYLHPKNKKIEKFFFEKCFGKGFLPKPKANINKYIDNYLSEYKKIEEENLTEFDESFNYEESTFVNIIYNNNNLLSVANHYYEYSGGAHHNSGINYFVIDLNQNKILTLKDIFKGNYKSVLSKKLTTRILQRNKVESLLDAGFFEETIPAENNFYLTDKGITFHYNMYSIAPYTQGETIVFIPFAELRSILNK